MSKRRAANRVKGQGNVFLRPRSPLWQISYRNGSRQVRESSGTADYAEAVKTLPRKLGEIALGKSAGDDLFVGGRNTSRLHLEWSKKAISWRNFFLVIDRVVHWFEAVHIRPLRSIALKKAEKWMLERFEMSDGLGAIYPSIVNSILAMRCLGYSLDDPQVIRALDEFEKLGIEEGDTFRM